ncbi:hypothetical protein AALO_G00202020 [Alosa alosa]|uniref:Uncharacterized protein n=1 Tax=Alosa alosa TaxID=278164 RepID=A0AAV6G2T8_9TELE|nr:hypothetical protein AALO_G00202020 [Alosa alosa]
MMETLRPPALQVQVPREEEEDEDGGGRGGGRGGGGSASAGDGGSDGRAWSSSSTPTQRRRRFKMRRMKELPSEREGHGGSRLDKGGLLRRATSKDYLQLPAIEITPSSDEDAASWSNCSTPSASPRRKRFLLRKWLKVREWKENVSESSQPSSQQSSQQSSHDDDATRFLTPFIREER